MTARSKALEPPVTDPPDLEPPDLEPMGTDPLGAEPTGAEPAATETPDPESPGTERAVRTALKWAALVTLLLLGLFELLWGGGGLAGPPQAAQRPAGRSVEELARRIGCKAEITADATDLRQGMCTSGGEEIWIATFPTPKARDAWISEAEAYGGSYLVGDGWVVVLSDTTTDMLHGLLGGVVVNGADHTGGHAHAGGG